MRLINVDTYEVTTFMGDAIPEYAILSHTWGRDEVLLQDLTAGNLPLTRRKKAFQKIEFCCRQAKADGWHFAWIDTCCIDKTSSAELSEAINSMYRWYANAMTCYAYLSDTEVRSTREFLELLSPRRPRPLPRWFSRGWTLQELIAPFDVLFFNVDWVCIGSKRTLTAALSQATGIPTSVLDHSENLYKMSVASRLRWSSGRFTTREEDAAYCLLGIFNVNIPLLYGEGPRAFIRLQKEILKETNDHTMFLWGLLTDAQYQVAVGMQRREKLTGMVAQSPRDFHTVGISTQIESLKFADTPHVSATGLRITLHVTKLSPGEVATLDQFLPPRDMRRAYVGALNCTQPRDRLEPGWESAQATVLLLRLTPEDSPSPVIEFARIPLQSPPVPRDLARTWPRTKCHIPTTLTKEDYFCNDLRVLRRSCIALQHELLGRLPAAVHPIFTPYFGLSQGTFYIHRLRISDADHPRAFREPIVTLVYGLKEGMVFCDVRHEAEGEGAILPDVDSAYRALDARGQLMWTETFGRLGPVAECAREVDGVRVSCRVSSRPARRSDLGRYSALTAAMDFVVYTPWVVFEPIGEQEGEEPTEEDEREKGKAQTGGKQVVNVNGCGQKYFYHTEYVAYNGLYP